MMKYFTFFIVYFLCSIVTAQSVFNCELISKTENDPPSQKVQVLVAVKPGTEPHIDLSEGTVVHYKAGNIWCITASLQTIKELAKQKNTIRIEHTQHHLQLMADSCMVRNRIASIKTGKQPLAQAYDGTGVVVGIIDSGTDFNHPDFKDSNGKSRIMYLWDMNKPASSNSPAPFGYGQEWNNAQIDLGQCTHSDASHFGHGSSSAGIAAGNGMANNKYEGVAPKADIVVVALDFGRPGYTIADAVQYIAAKAQLLGKPFVINASVGDYGGSHDGTDLEAQMINNMIANIPGRAMVASAGNAGSIAFHVGYNVIPADTNFTWITGNGTNIRLSEFSDTNQIKNVMYSVGVNNGALHNLGRIPFKAYNYALNGIKRDTIYHNTHRIGVVESIASINSFGVYELALRIKADSLNYLWRIEHNGTGRIDSWNFDYVSGTLPTTAQYPAIVYYKMADTTQSIVSSFQCSDEIITVANYVNRNQYFDVNNNLQLTTEVPGAIAASSSVGPSRDNRVKPDIAASGATILTSTDLSILPNLIANAPQVVAQGGFHISAGGTSASSPVVAGLAALYLQKNPTATNRQVKTAIINCAYGDAFTTGALPNYRWGYGKLDGFAAMTCGEVLSAISMKGELKGIEVFPNPLTEQTLILFNNYTTKTIRLYNTEGQEVLTDFCTSDQYILRKNNLSPGLYLLTSEEKGIINKVKLMVQ